ncbi:potassium channel family protein [Actinomycetospora chibensis]|uniref:Potassium channel family protein n=1 Tax=Actinomycetospora chibensis TaxID=663606 RepID=A0ABV9RMJ9_9PSEU|nr:potassium channel family protein [Actinomycetospora chibensis]MDD7922344.1 ion channel [Actinomycetospora chibensis]
MTTAHTLPRRRAAVALVRALIYAVLIVVVFYVVPLRMTVDVGTLLRLVAGLALLGALIAWQVRGIARSPYPSLRAFETLAVALPLFLMLFAATYTVLSQVDPASFSESLSRTDAIYFTVTVFATVGFGDIAPVSTVARVAVTVQMLANLLLLGFVVRAVLDAVERGRGRLNRTAP